jgi:hypothetical protein
VETAAHLVDHVIPPVPVRQWALSWSVTESVLRAREDPDQLR